MVLDVLDIDLAISLVARILIMDGLCYIHAIIVIIAPVIHAIHFNGSRLNELHVCLACLQGY